MREIKFRGWHTVKKIMFSAEEMATDQLTLLPTGQFINVSGSSTRLSEIYPSDKFIPLQYTGLKDKNGREIYEGDIIKINGGAEDVFFEVGFEDGCFIAKVPWCDGKETHYPELKMYIGWTFIPIYEVIGNIYENPKLLN